MCYIAALLVLNNFKFVNWSEPAGTLGVLMVHTHETNQFMIMLCARV